MAIGTNLYEKGGVCQVVILSFLISGITFLLGLLGVGTVLPAIINIVFGFFAK